MKPMILPILDRRCLLAAAAALPFVSACGAAPAEAKTFPKGKSNAEWKFTKM